MHEDRIPTPRFAAADLGGALALALDAHAGQVRKGTTTPYFAHLMEVAAIAMHFGADLDQVRAALLHDVLEDGGDPTHYRRRISRECGDDILALVEAATDTTETPKPPWRETKEAYVAGLAVLPARAKLVIASDKLANVHSMLRDHVRDPELWSRFRVAPQEYVWYFGACLRGLRTGDTTPELHELLDELQRRVLELAEHILLDGRSALGPDCPLCGRRSALSLCPLCGRPTPGLVDPTGVHWKNCPHCLGAARERARRAQ